VLVVLLVSLHAQKEKDKVSSLPGYINFSGLFDMYSGLLQLKPDPLMNMHYIFVTSMSATKDTDPLVLWLNGGPGCSSLLGFAQEIGPCLLQPGAKTFDTNLNPYAWNNNANVLFLENPPGVGFSQNEDKNFSYNENNTATNAYLALVEWFKLFPEYKTRDFWITGESYCGMYIPYLANEIINKNA
jgi:carboxypeptidase C (cathepsin A)